MGILTTMIHEEQFPMTLNESYMGEDGYALALMEAHDGMLAVSESVYMIDMEMIKESAEGEEKEESPKDEGKTEEAKDDSKKGSNGAISKAFGAISKFLESLANKITSAISGFINMVQNAWKSISDPVAKLAREKGDLMISMPGGVYGFTNVKPDHNIQNLSAIVDKVLFGSQANISNISKMEKGKKAAMAKEANSNKMKIASEVSKMLGCPEGSSYKDFLSKKYLNGEGAKEVKLSEVHNNMKKVTETIGILKARQKQLNNDLKSQAKEMRKANGDADTVAVARIKVQGLTMAVNIALADLNAHKDACIQFLNAVKGAIKNKVAGVAKETKDQNKDLKKQTKESKDEKPEEKE